MKRFVSALLSAAIVVSSASAMNASAENYGDGTKLVVLGDSIAAGYGLTDGEFNYGQICADYLGGNVENYAHSGDETDDLINIVSNFSAQQNSAVSDADVVVISIGANDLMQAFAKEFLKYAITKDMLTEKYASLTAEDIDAMEKVNLISLYQEMIDVDKAKAFAASDPLTFVTKLNTMGNTINSEVTQKYVIPNIQSTVNMIKEKNPDVRIIVQTIYNPIQFEDGFLEQNHSTDFVKAIDNVRRVFKNVLNNFRTQLKTVEGIEIADVYSDFSSTDEDSKEYSWYFTNMQAENMDIHPSQKGHLAIAANVLKVIGEKSDNGSKFRQIYNTVSDRSKYPAAALASYQEFCGTYSIGDVDDNGKIDSVDASAILKEYSLLSTQKTPLFDENQKKAADVNGDEFFDAKDASTLLGYYSSVSTGSRDTMKEYLKTH